MNESETKSRNSIYCKKKLMEKCYNQNTIKINVIVRYKKKRENTTTSYHTSPSSFSLLAAIPQYPTFVFFFFIFYFILFTISSVMLFYLSTVVKSMISYGWFSIKDAM